MIRLRYISVFSGIEAASVAWEPLGWEPVAFCEYDEFPSAVLAHHWPGVPNLGDITKVDWSEYADGTVDVVVGGSPCQSFSVAGNREGLRGESKLMWEYIRCVREVRPRWFVWENVPGCLSSGPDKDSRGEDFGCLLRAMDELGYGMAWRVFDAQFFGVAQRRRRVFLVGSLGNQRAAEILFEPESMRWDHPSSREKREALARAAQQRASEGGCDCLTPWDGQAQRVYAQEGVWPTLSARGGKAGSNGQTVLAYICMASGQANAEIEYDMAPAQSARQYKDPQIVCFNAGNVNDVTHIGEIQSQIAPALRSCRSGTNGTPVICMADVTSNAAVDADVCGTLVAHAASAPPVVCAPRCATSNGEDVVGALCARDFKGVGSQYVNEGKVIVQWTPTTTS